MRLWFVRVADDNITREAVKSRLLVPVLFKRIPFADCRIGMDYDAIAELVEKHYPGESAATKGQFKGALHRFLTVAVESDLVAICVNRDQDLIYGEILQGELRHFPGLENEHVKCRPIRLLTSREHEALESLSPPDAVRKYRGTTCKWLEDAELPEEEERERRNFYTSPSASQQRQVKFIRVGVDKGCGGRLSRIFPDNYYHFIPIPKHNDPEFCRFTYGDVDSATKFRSLQTLRTDDVLVFYGGFDPEAGCKQSRCVGIFCYLVVGEVFLFNKRQERAFCVSEPRDADLRTAFAEKASKIAFEEMRRKYGEYNAHLDDDRDCAKMEILICGNPKKSRLLCKVEILAYADQNSGKYILDNGVAEKWGLKTGADMTRCSVRTVDRAAVEDVVARLEKLP